MKRTCNDVVSLWFLLFVAPDIFKERLAYENETILGRPSCTWTESEAKASNVMKINAKTAIYGKSLILVPYRKDHVPKYHIWMQNEELLDKTASERLTLEQEYEMQQKWFHDEDKCTFIILSRTIWDGCKSETDSMVGDVNLFFNNNEDKLEAEIEVMVAEQSARNCGIGKEAVIAMIHYGSIILKVHRITAIIGNSNKESISLFSKLGFVKTKETAVFNESTYEICINQSFQEKHSKQIGQLRIGSYPIEEE